MSNNRVTVYRLVIVVLLIILVFSLVQSPRTTQAASQAAGAQMLAVTVYDVESGSIANVNSTWTKLADLATFTVNSNDSLVELTFNGRVFIADFAEPSSVAYFEMRVDGAASTIGTARASLSDLEEGQSVLVSFTGMFSGLSEGFHTASMWVRTASSTAFLAAVNPHNYESDVLIVKEHLPFGVTFLPLISK